MLSIDVVRSDQSRETAGFLVSVGLVGIASVRDVYLGGLFQRVTPLLVATIAFTFCTVLFLPAIFVGSGECRAALRRRFGDLVWVNITTAVAWLTFLYALKLIEPLVVQILYSGIGPLSVISIERYLSTAGRGVSLTRAERLAFLALLITLVFSAAVVVAGLSGAASQSIRNGCLGVVLAAIGGIAISVSTMLCRKLNDAGVRPAALLALRFPATALSATVMIAFSHSGAPGELGWADAMLGVALPLIIVPNYVNLVAISLASPLTVRVVLAAGPALIFFLQMIEGRLTASPYSLSAAILYGFAATSAMIARQRAIRATERSVTVLQNTVSTPLHGPSS